MIFLKARGKLKSYLANQKHCTRKHCTRYLFGPWNIRIAEDIRGKFQTS